MRALWIVTGAWIFSIAMMIGCAPKPKEADLKKDALIKACEEFILSKTEFKSLYKRVSVGEMAEAEKNVSVSLTYDFPNAQGLPIRMESKCDGYGDDHTYFTSNTVKVDGYEARNWTYDISMYKLSRGTDSPLPRPKWYFDE